MKQTTHAQKLTFLSYLSFHLSGALFSLDGPAALVGQEDSARPSLASARCLSGLPRAVYSCGPGQQEASGAKREKEDVEIRKSTEKNQRGTVRKTVRINMKLNLTDNLI